MIFLPTDLATYVLNKCITQDEPAQRFEQQISSNGEALVGNPTVKAEQPVHYNFKYLEDNDKDHGNHILDWMVSLDIVTLWGSCILFIFGKC